MLAACWLLQISVLSATGSPRASSRAVRVFSTEARSDAQQQRDDRRVQVDVVYSATPDFAVYAREAGRMLRERFSDVSVQLVALPVQQGSTSFKVLVDDTQVVTKRSDASGVALKLSALTSAVESARRRRRPLYNDNADEPK